MLRHIAVVIVLIAGSFPLATNSPADLTPADSRKALPGIALTDDKGGPVDLSAYKGRVVLLDFWATWCTGCKEEIPWLVDKDAFEGEIQTLLKETPRNAAR